MVSDAQLIFSSACGVVKPDKLVFKCLKLKDNILSINNLKLNLETLEHIYVIGAGKASGLMALAVETILENRIDAGCIAVKYGHSCQLDKIECIEAGHPLPDKNSVVASGKIIQIARKAQEKDLVICLFSGGGSSLLTDCPAGVTLEDLQLFSSLLLRSGADINEINTIRKHLSEIKGGNLSKIIYPATTLSLLLSDVVGDSLDIIASGATVPDSSTFQDAVYIINKYKLGSKTPLAIKKIFAEGVDGQIPDTPKPEDKFFQKTFNFIIGNNQTALEEAMNAALKLGYNTQIITSTLQGEVDNVAKMLVNQAMETKNNSSISKPVCLLYGGETTVKVKGDGVGGRNQHLALLTACLLKNLKGITLLSAGTDGTDGPTDAAGAIVNCETYHKAINMGIYPEKYVENFDSHHFFETIGGLIISGPTFTNVMDIIIVFIE